MLKTKEQALRDNKEEHDKLVRAYLKLNAEEWGKVILDDLERRCGQNISSVNFVTFEPSQTMYACGKRDIWLYINTKLTEGKNGLD